MRCKRPSAAGGAPSGPAVSVATCTRTALSAVAPGTTLRTARLASCAALGERWEARRTGQQRGRRRGDVFALRLTAEERAALEAAQQSLPGPRGLGPWLVWAALQAGSARAPVALPNQVQPTGVISKVIGGVAGSAPFRFVYEPPVILDLCAGSGAWSEPYAAAGYQVIRCTLPDCDVRNYSPPAHVHGVLAAPPCNEFSLAKNGQERDLDGGLELVLHCLRIIALAQPVWWALENPVGLLGHWLGEPRFTFQPYEFGDPWTKRTALWGRFNLPVRGPFVDPLGSAMDRATAAERAITPPGFAAAFAKANP